MRVRKAYPENPCTLVLGSVNHLILLGLDNTPDQGMRQETYRKRDLHLKNEQCDVMFNSGNNISFCSMTN